jgi:protein-disulfide isomerase
MKPESFKALLIVQVITLILVVILFFNNLSKPVMPINNGTGIEMKMDQQGKIEVDSKNDFVFGNVQAPNFLIVFSRYNCEVCRDFYNQVVDSLNGTYIRNGQLKIIFKELVDTADKVGTLMAKLAEVARQTNHFPEMHRALTTGDEPKDSTAVMELAKKAGLIASDITLRLNSPETLNKIKENNEAAKKLNITGTPSFVFNGKVFLGYMTYKDISSKMQQAGTKDQQLN